MDDRNKYYSSYSKWKLSLGDYKRFDKVEDRVGELEDWKRYVQGALAMITVVSGTLHAKLFKFI